MTEYGWQVFVCHASEDKDTVVRPLAKRLAELGVAVWLDEAEMRVGDSLREKIDSGLSRSRFGVVVLSPSFFAKSWPRAELDGLVSKESVGSKVVLPVWHDVTETEVRQFSPILSGRYAARTIDGIFSVADKICAALTSADVRNPAAPELEGRLSKRFLFSLPEGRFLLGSAYGGDGLPLLAEVVPEEALREELWRKIAQKRWSGTKAYVFRNVDHYRSHMSARGALPSPIRVPASKEADASLEFDVDVAKGFLAANKPPPRAWISSIKELRFDDERHQFSELDAFASLTHLEVLDLADLETVSLRGLEQLTSLRQLDLGETRIDDISQLAGLHALEHLTLGTAQPGDLSPLADLVNLKRLELTAVPALDFSVLGNPTSLEYLDLSRTNIEDLSPLRRLSKLKYLSLWRAEAVRNLEPISGLQGLKVLDIDYTPVVSVACLGALKGLRFLDAAHAALQDAETLKHIANLVISNGYDFPSTLRVDAANDWERWYWRHVLGVPEERLAEVAAATDGSPEAINRLYWSKV